MIFFISFTYSKNSKNRIYVFFTHVVFLSNKILLLSDMFIVYLTLIACLICNMAYGETTCDPRTFSPGDYPSILTDLEVVGSHPLKLRAHSRLVNSTSPIFVGVNLVCKECGEKE